MCTLVYGKRVDVLLLKAAEYGAAVEHGEHRGADEPGHDGGQQVPIDEGLNKYGIQIKFKRT